MPRRKSPLSLSVQQDSDPTDSQLIFKRISSGFYWDIPADILTGVPFLQLNLTSIDAIEHFPIADNAIGGRRVLMASGKVYEFVSQSQIIALMCGLNALKTFLQSGRIPK
jgi:hypothetical protein